MPKTTTNLVLGSSSPFRRQLLQKLGLPFASTSPQVDESPMAGEGPSELVARLAEAKARAAATHHSGAMVIGSDQVACIDGVILGKPGGHEQARAQLQAASGRIVTFHTGLCLFNSASGRAQVAVELFHVHFRTLSNRQIERYLERERPYECAGSFKSEGYGITLFSALEGRDPNALVGLPLIALVDMLAEEQIDLP
jgi:septum formation protein